MTGDVRPHMDRYLYHSVNSHTRTGKGPFVPWGTGSSTGFAFFTPRAINAGNKLKKLMKNLMKNGMKEDKARKMAANMLRGNATTKKKNSNVFHRENPLAAVRSRTGSTASSTASDPHNLSSIVGINEPPRSGVPYSELNSKGRAALKESLKLTFGRRFPSGNTKTRSKSQRVAEAIAEGRSRTAARNANQSRRAASKAREANEASKRLNAFSRGLSNRGASSTLSKAQLALLSYKKK